MPVMVAKKRMVTLYITVVAMFLTLAYFGYHYSNNMKLKRAQIETTGFSTDMAYFDLPRISLNLGGGMASTQMRIDLSLEVAKRDLPMLEGYQPKITDRLNRFLTGIDPADTRRVSAVTALRHDMLEQVNRVGMPVPVHDVLLRQLVIM